MRLEPSARLTTKAATYAKRLGVNSKSNVHHGLQLSHALKNIFIGASGHLQWSRKEAMPPEDASINQQQLKFDGASARRRLRGEVAEQNAFVRGLLSAGLGKQQGATLRKLPSGEFKE